eukprot:1052854-Pyramimonas_sp.AAC.1
MDRGDEAGGSHQVLDVFFANHRQVGLAVVPLDGVCDRHLEYTPWLCGTRAGGTGAAQRDILGPTLLNFYFTPLKYRVGVGWWCKELVVAEHNTQHRPMFR